MSAGSDRMTTLRLGGVACGVETTLRRTRGLSVNLYDVPDTSEIVDVGDALLLVWSWRGVFRILYQVFSVKVACLPEDVQVG
jgi:hypothetical protein